MIREKNRNRALSFVVALSIAGQAYAPARAIAKGKSQDELPTSIAFPFPFMDTDPPPHFVSSKKDPSVTKYRTWYSGNDADTIAEMRLIDPKLATPKTDTSKPAIDFTQGQGAEAKTLATFRASSFNEKAQSELASFHFSRILGTGGVPAAEYRTMSKKEFNALAAEALSKLAGKTDQKSIEARVAWENAKLAAEKGDDSVAVRGKPDLIYGAMTDKIRGEQALPGVDGHSTLRQQRFFKALASGESVEKTLADLKSKDPKAYAQALQDLALARDLSSQLLLDAMLMQGNDFEGMQVKKLDHFIDKAGKLAWKTEPDLRDLEGASAPLQLDRMVSKDSEDGLNWRASASPRAQLLREVRHLDPLVYDRMQWLSGLFKDGKKEPALKKYFTETAGLSEANYEKIKIRVQQYAGHFAKLKADGTLKLDLDLERHFAAGNPRSEAPARADAPAVNLDPNAAPSDLTSGDAR